MVDDDISELVDGPGPAPVKIARRWWVVSAAAALLLVVLLGAVIFYRQADKPFGFEVQWMGELVEARVPVFTALALAFNWIGGGIGGIVIVPLVIIAGLLLWRRPWAALYFVCATIASALVVLVMKSLIGRPRPTDILVTADVGSFPSGHSANAALIATTLGIIFWRTWIWIVGAAYTLLMMGEICLWNLFGFDRGAAQMYFVAPVPFTRVLIAKNLNALLWVGVGQATTTLLCIAFRFPVTPKLVLDSAAVTAVVLIYLVSAGNYMSVSNPRPADPESAMRSRSAGGVQVLLMFLLPLVFIPAALAYFARWAFGSELAFFGVLGVMGAIGAMVYWVALDSTAEYADKHREAIVTALAAGQGPISS